MKFFFANFKAWSIRLYTGAKVKTKIEIILSSDDCDEQELTRGVRNKFIKNFHTHIAYYIYGTIIYNLR